VLDLPLGGRWDVVGETLPAWAVTQKVEPVGLGPRITYLVTSPREAEGGPDCDFAVPIR
jgi:hypothetical protein